MAEYRKLDDMVPSEIVRSLDEYIVGQEDAKRTIAVAIRNRVRRKRLPEEVRDEVTPKNILMIGPTGVGKTEIARRIAKLANAPFIKVEATKYTEVGYVGRDVESMVRDLMASSVQMVKAEMAENKKAQVDQRVEERLLDLLLPSQPSSSTDVSSADTREKFRSMLRSGTFDGKEVEMNIDVRPRVEVIGTSTADDIQQTLSNLTSMFASGAGTKRRKLTVKRAREIITQEEMEKVIDTDKAVDEALERAQEMGIIFIDEIDKVASHNSTSNSDVSREGVQRDILPIVEGTTVSTKWGAVDTTNILFIAAGAFSMSKPSDLIPELQGRFPLHVELKDLTADDFYRILTEPQNAIVKQYKALLGTEGVTLSFTDAALRKIADIAYEVNMSNDNIGARRLHTVMEKLLEELAFSADELSGQSIEITEDYVRQRLSGIAEDRDLSRYIL